MWPPRSHLYSMLRRQGCAYISVCHRASAIAFHQRVFELQSGGAWEIRERAEGAPPAAIALANGAPPPCRGLRSRPRRCVRWCWESDTALLMRARRDRAESVTRQS